MASITKQTTVDAPPEEVWEVLADFGAVHRFAAGFVTGTRLDGADTRIVTFASGAEACERLVTVDPERRRLVYSIVDSQLGLTHDNSVAEVGVDDSGRTVFTWTKDVLPDSAAPVVAGLMDTGLAAIESTFARGEGTARVIDAKQ